MLMKIDVGEQEEGEMVDTISCFEDYEVGQEGVTPGRTIGEAEIVMFAGIVGDYSPWHLDRHFSANTVYGERVAHGWLVMGLVPGMLSCKFPHIVGRDIPQAFLCSIDANYRRGLTLGDSIKVAWRIAEKTDDPIQQEFGRVKTAFQVLNQEGTLIDDGTISIKVRRRTIGDAKLKFEPATPWDIKKILPNPEPDRIYYLDDFVQGEGQQIGGRTITETDIVNFVGLTQDHNRLYLDSVFAAKSTFGERIAPNALIACIVSGIWVQKGFWARSRRAPVGYAGHLGDGAEFLAPVKIGDTIHFQWRVGYTRISRSKPDRGILKNEFQILNQRDEVVQQAYTLNVEATQAGVK